MLNAKALALATGIVWGAVIFITTLLSTATGYGRAFLQAYGSLHPGYSISMGGAVVGLVYAFLCAALAGYVLVRLYNYLQR